MRFTAHNSKYLRQKIYSAELAAHVRIYIYIYRRRSRLVVCRTWLLINCCDSRVQRNGKGELARPMVTIMIASRRQLFRSASAHLARARLCRKSTPASIIVLFDGCRDSDYTDGHRTAKCPDARTVASRRHQRLEDLARTHRRPRF